MKTEDKEQLIQIAKELAFPELYAKDYEKWFHGDGPFEFYCDELSERAREILMKMEINLSTETFCAKTEDHFHVVEKLPSGVWHGCTACGYPIA